MAIKLFFQKLLINVQINAQCFCQPLDLNISGKVFFFRGKTFSDLWYLFHVLSFIHASFLQLHEKVAFDNVTSHRGGNPAWFAFHWICEIQTELQISKYSSWGKKCNQLLSANPKACLMCTYLNHIESEV